MTRADGTDVEVPSTARAIRFFDDAFAVFGRASARAGVRTHDLVVAGVRVRLRFAGEALEPRLLPALAHREVPIAEDEPALTVALFDSRTTGEQMVPPAWSPHDYGAKGQIAGFDGDRIVASFMPGVDVLNLYDRSRSLGLYWVGAPEVVPWWETPLRTMLHWWAAPTSLQPVHGGGVGVHGDGVLVVGDSGSGKSTTALACLEAGFDYVGDDYLVVDVDTPTAFSLYSTAKLERENLLRFPSLAPLVANADALDTQKAIVRLFPSCSAQLSSAVRLRAIVLPRVTGRPESRIAPGSQAEALRVLATTTSFHLPGQAREVMTKLNRLVRALPCHQLHAGTDVEQLAATVAGLIR